MIAAALMQKKKLRKIFLKIFFLQITIEIVHFKPVGVEVLDCLNY